MAGWIALGEDATADYLSGALVPVEVRETEHGVEVFDFHDWPEKWEVHRICNRCGLLPLDYDAIETECDGSVTPEDIEAGRG